MAAYQWQAFFHKKPVKIALFVILAAVIVTIIAYWEGTHKYAVDVTVNGQTQSGEVVMKYRNLDAWTGFRTIDGTLEVYLESDPQKAFYRFKLLDALSIPDDTGLDIPEFLFVCGSSFTPGYYWVRAYGHFYFDRRMENFALLTDQLECCYGDEGFIQTLRDFDSPVVVNKND